MAQMIYNGINLPFQKMTDASEEAVRTEDGMDYLYTKRSYTVESVLDPSIPGLLLPGETFIAAIKRIEHKLLEARRELSLGFGNGTVLKVAVGFDAKNGPFPEVLQFTRFDGQTHALIRFRITCHTIDCEGVRGPQWLSNRWTESVRISGEDFRTVKTRRGKLIVRPGPLFVDALRGLITPVIPPMFLRTVANYEVQSDGLALSYHFEDEEQYALPVAGSVKASGTCRISAEKGIWRYAEVSVKLIGDVLQNKQKLVQLAAIVAMDRIERIGPARDGPKGRFMLISGAVAEELWKNEITLTIRTLLQPERKAPGLNLKDIINKIADAVKRNVGDLVPDFVPDFGNFDPRKWGKDEPNNAGKIGGNIFKLPKAGGVPGNNAAFPPPGKIGEVRLPKGLGIDSFGPKPYGGDQPDMGLRSTAGLGLVAAALGDPCMMRAIQDFNGKVPLPTTNIGQEIQDQIGFQAFRAPLGPLGLQRGHVGGNFGGPWSVVGAAIGAGVAGAAGSVGGVGGVFGSNFGAGVGGGGGGGGGGGAFGEGSSGIGYGPIEIVRGGNNPVLTRVVEVANGPGIVDDSADYLMGGIYTDYRVASRFENNSSFAVLTEQRAKGLTHFIPTAAASTRMVVEWTATRVGEPPVIPDSNLQDDNAVLLSTVTYPPCLDDLSEDGVTLLFTFSGVYTYGFKDQDKIKGGATVPPWMADLMGLQPRATIYGGPVLANVSGTELVAGVADLAKWEVNMALWRDKQPKA